MSSGLYPLITLEALGVQMMCARSAPTCKTHRMQQLGWAQCSARDFRGEGVVSSARNASGGSFL